MTYRESLSIYVGRKLCMYFYPVQASAQDRGFVSYISLFIGPFQPPSYTYSYYVETTYGRRSYMQQRYGHPQLQGVRS